MTSIIFSKSMALGSVSAKTYYVKLYASNVEEIQTKNNVVYEIPEIGVGSAPTTSSPKSRGMDMRMIKRVFTITGEIDVSSSDDVYVGGSSTRVPKSAPEVRDMLSYMNLYGGIITFQYGIPGDYAGLTMNGYDPKTELGYYSFSGINVLFNRLVITEADGDDKGVGRLTLTSVASGDFLVTSGSHSFNDSVGIGTPKYGVYYLPSKYLITIEAIELIEQWK
jgi:hypothetical protein